MLTRTWTIHLLSNGATSEFSDEEWQDIVEGLLEAASTRHSGPKADRYEELARRIREEVLAP